VARVVVIGGGIAGMGAAWSLRRSGFDVTVLEGNAALGGNAKTHVWDLGGRTLRTGLSVLAWPRAYFHNYRALLAALEVPTRTTPRLRFFIDDDGAIWAHDRPSPRFAADLARWERLVARVRSINAAFSGAEPSLYRVSLLNPLNLVPLRRLARAYGISRAFWEGVFVPIHSSSFLSTRLDGVPAVIAPVLEDIFTLARGGSLETWAGTSVEVFDKMAEGITVHLGRPARRVVRDEGGVVVIDERRDTHRCDAVVFACAAPVVLRLLARATALERSLLGGVRYADQRDPTFATGVIHSDAGVLPADHREAILDGYANFIAVPIRAAERATPTRSSSRRGSTRRATPACRSSSATTPRRRPGAYKGR
jgi:predicted NAD/FAD-binding protein